MIRKPSNKIRIILKSYNSKIINTSYLPIIEFLRNKTRNLLEFSNLKIKYVSLPTTKRIYCVLRSPHGDNDSREHFEVRTHTKIIEIDHNNLTFISKIFSEMQLHASLFSRIELV